MENVIECGKKLKTYFGGVCYHHNGKDKNKVEFIEKTIVVNLCGTNMEDLENITKIVKEFGFTFQFVSMANMPFILIKEK